MIKELKNGSCKLSVKTILVCMTSVTMLLTSSPIAKGIQLYNTSVFFSNTVNLNSKDKFIIDAPIKFYDDLSKVERLSNFKFKVPDFLPEKNKVTGYEVRKVSDKDYGLVIFFENSDGSFSLLISECDPVEVLRIVENEKTKAIKNTKVDSDKEPLKINDINGLNMTITSTFPARQIGNSYSKETQKTSKYYIWRDGGVWYSLEYNSTSIGETNNNVQVNISKENIVKIVKSLKYPEEVTSVNYSLMKDVSTKIPKVVIYDKEDLEKAKNLLRFNPKFPLNICKDIDITGSILGISQDSDLKNNKINYELNNFYSYKNGSITFTVQQNSKVYEDIIKNNSISGENSEVNKTEPIKVESFNENNMKVFKYSIKGLIPQVNYIWKENNIFYSVIFFENIENSDDIVKLFIDSQPIS